MNNPTEQQGEPEPETERACDVCGEELDEEGVCQVSGCPESPKFSEYMDCYCGE